MTITAVRRGHVGARFRGHESGYLFALTLEQVDTATHLHDAGLPTVARSNEHRDELKTIVTALLLNLEDTFGEPRVTAPPLAIEQSKWEQFRSFLRPTQLRDIDDLVNPDGLSPNTALMSAAHDSSELKFAIVSFERHAGRADALVCASDGRPILWVWLSDEVKDQWPTLSQAASGALPCLDASVDWDKLLPTWPWFSTALPRVSFYRGESAIWRDGTRRLGFNAGLGVKPPEVYVPTAKLWSSSVPPWASSLRPMIIDDLQESGAVVVEQDHAAVFGVHKQG